NGFEFGKGFLIAALERVQHKSQTLYKQSQFFRKRTRRDQNIPPDMERTRCQTCYRLPAGPRQITVRCGLIRKERRKNLRKMTDFGDKPVVVLRSDDVRKCTHRAKKMLELLDNSGRSGRDRTKKEPRALKDAGARRFRSGALGTRHRMTSDEGQIAALRQRA